MVQKREIKVYESGWARMTALTQSFVYIATGIWPVLDIDSFMAVTGPKTEIWLVRTVGLLIAAVGISLLAAWRKNMITFPLILLAILNALFLTGIDVFYASIGRIAPVYYVDAALEILFVLAWIRVLTLKRSAEFEPGGRARLQGDHPDLGYLA